MIEKSLRTLARRFFRLELPALDSDLKHAYRRESKHHHPDKGGDAVYFGKLTQAYKVLRRRPDIIIYADDTNQRTVEGDLLTDLGEGVLNGETCKTCNGDGYTKIKIDPYVQCSRCQGSGWSMLCTYCKNRLTEKPCSRCLGKGWLALLASNIESFFQIGLNYDGMRCVPCAGKGGYRSPVDMYKFCRCVDCNGNGEISQDGLSLSS